MPRKPSTDSRIDAQMARTNWRPIVVGQVTPRQALAFALVLAIASMAILLIWVNTITAVLTFCSLIGYAVIYTRYLKRATPQNIVIGGIAGAAPPLLGWSAITALLTFASLIGYAVVYTVFLKRATPQNIVIGGLAGAAPPLLGWAAVKGWPDGVAFAELFREPYGYERALVLVMIIFLWTPPRARCRARRGPAAPTASARPVPPRGTCR